MKGISIVVILFLVVKGLYAQQPFYEVTQGNGNGIRFWQNDLWKIHMGNWSEYQYGPVTDYSIKSNMDNTANRGWTWGISGQTPIAAISNAGHMQIAGKFTSSTLSTGNQINSRLIGLYDASSDWYGFGIQSYQMRLQVGSPSARFSFFAGDNTELLTINGNGNVGIGVSQPSSHLTIAGAQSTEETVINATNMSDQDFNVKLSAVGGSVKRTIIGPSTLNRFSLGVGVANNNEYLTIISGGNVGIGTVSPDQKLTVNGTIHSKEVKVDLSVPAPDYVFENDYKLPSLEEVKNYIDQNKHLPEVPSAKEMETNGVQLGEMNMLLLKKMEEITLYMIELKNENQYAKARMQSMQKEIDQLKK